MKVTFQRIIKAGFINFTRGGIISWSAVLQVVNTLAMIVAIVLLQAVLNFSLTQIKNKVDVTIYFNVGAAESGILALRDSLEKLPEVGSVSYVSADQVLADFRELHKDDYPTIQALDEIKGNPLGAELNIKAKEVGQYESIEKFLKSDNDLVLKSSNIIHKTNYAKNKPVIDRLSNIISGAQKLGFLLTLYLVISSILITFNTIRLTIFISKEEIGVMQLVGASNTRVRGPFMVEGAIYGVVATVVTMLIFIPITMWLGNNMTEFLGMNIFSYYLSNFFQILAIVLFSGIILGMFSSFLAVKKYLNK